MAFPRPSPQEGYGVGFGGQIQASVHLSRLALKPCINCRQRKVRCDRGNPCTGCIRFARTCTYEESRSPSSTEVSPQQGQGQRGSPQDVSERSSSSGLPTSVLRYSLYQGHSISHDEGEGSGWLLYERNLSLYVPPGHFVKLFEETEEMGILLKATPKDTSSSLLSHGMISPQIMVQDPLTILPHPSAEQGEFLCNLFFSRIEPFVRIVHEKSFRKDRQAFLVGRCPSPFEFEALLFAIYLLTVLLSPTELVEQGFGEYRSEVVRRYQAATQTALSRCQIMRSHNFVSFQALLYWISFLYESGDTESATSFVGIAHHIARRLGLHKDSILTSRSGISPFVAEMRKRAWNHLSYLSIKGYEIDGIDSCIDDNVSLYPVNVNDADWEDWLHTKLRSPPQDRPGFSDVTFVILRRQLAALMQTLLNEIPYLSVERAETILQKARDEVSEALLPQSERHGPHQIQMHRLIQSVTQLYLDKIALAIDIGHVKYGRKQGDEIKNQIFYRAISILSALHKLNPIPGSSPEFHAAAAILCHLIHRPEQFPQQAKESAWREIETFFQRHSNSELGGGVWEVMQFWRQRAKDSFGAIGGIGDVAERNLAIPQQQHGLGQSLWEEDRGGEVSGIELDWSSTLLEDMEEFPQRGNPTS